jgi:SOS-response transcriptional repressor LexA
MTIASVNLLLSSCRALRFTLNPPPFAFKPLEHARRCTQSQSDAPDVLRSDAQLPSQSGIINPPPLPFPQLPLHWAKMGAQIETPVEGTLYKHAFMNVNSKSALLSQNVRALGARIRAVRTAKGLTQKEFAPMLKVSQVAVSNWEKGADRPKAEILAKLAAMTADPDLRTYFVRESGMAVALGIESAAERTPATARPVPLLKDPIAAGTPRATDEAEIAQMLEMPRSWFPASGEFFAFKVVGDSMAPVVEEGYIVIIDASRRDPRKLVGQMVAAREDNGVTIKWLRKDKEAFLLVPQHVSPRIPVRIMRADDDWAIVGTVVKWIGQPPPIRK